MALGARDLTLVKLQRLTDEFGGQAEVARLLRVDRSRVSRWLRGEAPDPMNSAKLEALEYAFGRLLRTFKPATAVKFLFGINAHLGNRRPIDLLMVGRVADVIGAIEQAEQGSYA